MLWKDGYFRVIKARVNVCSLSGLLLGGDHYRLIFADIVVCINACEQKKCIMFFFFLEFAG